MLWSENHHPNSKLIEVSRPMKINFREDLIENVFREGFHSFQHNTSRLSRRLNTTDCYRFCISFHLFPEVIIMARKISWRYFERENVSKTKYNMLICHFPNNKMRLMLEGSCDPVKLQYENDFEAIHKCELATIRIVRWWTCQIKGRLY